jgi:hypothetical protein
LFFYGVNQTNVENCNFEPWVVVGLGTIGGDLLDSASKVSCQDSNSMRNSLSGQVARMHKLILGCVVPQAGV